MKKNLAEYKICSLKKEVLTDFLSFVLINYVPAKTSLKYAVGMQKKVHSMTCLSSMDKDNESSGINFVSNQLCNRS